MKNNVLLTALERNISEQQSFRDEISSLPKGKIVLRKISNYYYYYLLYRDHNKVKNTYLGPSDTVSVDEIQKKIDRRNFLQEILKELKAEEREIRRAIA